MKVIKIAQIPPPTVQVTATIREALPAIKREHGCAVAVMDGNRLVGTLARDAVLTRVVGSGLNPDSTKVSEVMQSPADTVSMETDTAEALKWMFAHRKCCVGVVDPQGTLKGWLAVCDLFQDHVDDLTRELDSLASYISADGPGG